MNQPDRIFKALADPARIKILGFLLQPDAACCVMDGCVCACDVERVLGVSQATVSHHMKLLVDAGFVRAAKRGRWMLYSVDAVAFQQAAAWLAPFAKAEEGPATCLPCAVSA
jgi:ArsR family transcriptional regulator